MYPVLHSPFLPTDTLFGRFQICLLSSAGRAPCLPACLSLCWTPGFDRCLAAHIKEEGGLLFMNKREGGAAVTLQRERGGGGGGEERRERGERERELEE